MDSLNLPMHLAQFADWEYAEYDTANGSWTLELFKSGIVPVALNGSATLTLPRPTRSGIDLTVMVVERASGTLTISSGSDEMYSMNHDDSITANASFVMPADPYAFVVLKSVPMTVPSAGAVAAYRSYRWAITSNHSP